MIKQTVTEQDIIKLASKIIENQKPRINCIFSREDILSELVLYAYQVMGRYDESRGVKLTTYLYANLFGYIKNIINRKVNKKSTPPLYTSKPCAYNDHNQDYIDVNDYIESLDSKTDQIILRSKMEGLTIKEIANAVGLSSSAVTNRLDSIRRRLQQHEKHIHS